MLECALKAFMANSGVDEEVLRRKFGHGVKKLSDAAGTRGLPLPNPVPDWLDQLARVYDAPFVGRYPMGLNGVVLPNQRALAKELRTY